MKNFGFWIFEKIRLKCGFLAFCLSRKKILKKISFLVLKKRALLAITTNLGGKSLELA